MSILTRIITPAGEKVSVYSRGPFETFDQDSLGEFGVRYQFGGTYLDYYATDHGPVDAFAEGYRDIDVNVIDDYVWVYVDEAFTPLRGSLTDDLKNNPDRMLLNVDRYRVQRTPVDESTMVRDVWGIGNDEHSWNEHPHGHVIMSEMPAEIRVLIRGLTHQLAEILHPRDVGSLKGLLVRNGDAK